MWYSFPTPGFKCPFLRVEEGPEQPEGAGIQQSRQNGPQEALPKAWARGEPQKAGRTSYSCFSDSPILGKAFLSPESCDYFYKSIGPKAKSLQAETPSALSFSYRSGGGRMETEGPVYLFSGWGVSLRMKALAFPWGWRFQVARPQNMVPVPQLPDLPSMAQPWWKAVMLRGSCHPGCCVWGQWGLGEARSLRRSGGGACPTGIQEGPWICLLFQNLVILKYCSHLYDSPPQPVFVSDNGLLDEPC